MKSSWVFRKPAFVGGVKERDETRAPRARPAWLIPAMLVAPVVIAVGLFLWVLASVPMVGINVEGSRNEITPGTPIEVTVPSLGASVVAATLTEAVRGIDGAIIAERDIPVSLAPLVGGERLQSRYQVQAADGSAPLTYDGTYRLSVTVERWAPAFPLPQQVTRTEEHRFATLTTPQVWTPGELVELRYQQPVELQWNLPVQDFAVTTSPETGVRTWLDPARPNVGYVELVQPALGAEYAVSVVEATGINGAPLTRPAELRVETAPPSEPVLDRVQLNNGVRVVVPWDQPLQAFGVAVTPAVATSVEVDATNSQIGYVNLLNAKQGQEYTVQITSAVSSRGAPIEGTREFSIRTPEALKITGFSPSEQPQFGVPRQTPITIDFSKDVGDRGAAEAAISITPAVPGKFEWLSPTRVQFVPEGFYPEVTDFAVQVASGRDGIHAADGGYLEEFTQFTFWTAREKLIQVNLSTFTMVLWEDGEAIWSARVTTGVPGAETPTGRYEVLYKIDQTRMRGTNPTGRTYDIPDVPWVLPFLGDYAIHGNYWTAGFGQQGSNGCVGLPPSQAKFVYDWAPVGTPIRIHY
jgi:lipoprotein-anchoring transpeptidase ErfK/SrfK